MTENVESGPDSARTALQEALASIPPDARPPRAPEAPPPDRARAEALGSGIPEASEDPRPDEPQPFAGEDDPVVKHITSLGSIMTRRLDKLDHRLDELADSLGLLLASLTDPGPPGPAAPEVPAPPESAPGSDPDAAGASGLTHDEVLEPPPDQRPAPGQL